jgi:transposase-like protein
MAAMVSVASKIGCTPKTLRSRVNKSEVNSGNKPGITSHAAAKIKQLEGENKELK